MGRTARFSASFFILLSGISGLLNSAAQQTKAAGGEPGSSAEEKKMIKKIDKTDKEWKEILTPDEYRVLRRAGTERPFSGKYNDFYEKGAYSCAACGTPLFASETKYDHGTGWPSFTAPIDKNRLEFREDRFHGMIRTEVRCVACGSHLGHVFEDGPAPTGEHYCINSIALKFVPGERFST